MGCSIFLMILFAAVDIDIVAIIGATGTLIGVVATAVINKMRAKSKINTEYVDSTKAMTDAMSSVISNLEHEIERISGRLGELEDELRKRDMELLRKRKELTDAKITVRAQENATTVLAARVQYLENKLRELQKDNDEG